MQLALTYAIEILVFAFLLLISFDLIVGLIILWQLTWQRTTAQTQQLPYESNNIHNFARILTLIEQ